MSLFEAALSSQHRSRFLVRHRTGRNKSTFREYAEALFVALLIAMFIRSFLVQAFKIPSGSMLPTLQIGDHILVSKFSYGLRLPYPFEMPLIQWQQPERGDVVVFLYPRDKTKDFIKRVVARGGDEVRIINKQLFVNGVPEKNDHAYFDETSGTVSSLRDNFPGRGIGGERGTLSVPNGKLFVMGDNRDHSHDSRFWGFVDEADVKGKAFLVYWSWDGIDRWIRWERLGSLIS